MVQKRLLLLPVLALFSCGAGAHAQSPADVRYVVVEIKNGPVLHGELIRRDAKSITIRRADDSCGIKIDARDVAGVSTVAGGAGGSAETPGARRAVKMSREAVLSLGARGRP